MALSTEGPHKYVCMSCKSLHAGIPHRGSGDNLHYDPPTRCGACGETDLVLSTKYPLIVTRGPAGSH